MLPSHRPMDNMAAGWPPAAGREFALCNLGLPSPYLTIAFPNGRRRTRNIWTLEHVPADDLRHWKKIFYRFLQYIDKRTSSRKRIVLKSPPHTGRVKVLLEMFPDAKFVHIVRNPFVIFPSTVHLWKTLYSTQGMQKPRSRGVRRVRAGELQRMYERFEIDRESIPAGNFCEVRYETLVTDPIAGIKQVYEKLGLGDSTRHCRHSNSSKPPRATKRTSIASWPPSCARRSRPAGAAISKSTATRTKWPVAATAPLNKPTQVRLISRWPPRRNHFSGPPYMAVDRQSADSLAVNASAGS